MRVLEHRVPGTMTNLVWSGFSNRTGRCGPQVTVRIVTQEHAITRRIANRIVVPGRDSIEKAVARPCRSAAAFADDESTRRISDDIHPRRWRIIAPRQVNLVFASLIEPAQAIEALQSCAGIGRVGVNRDCPEWNDIAIHDDFNDNKSALNGDVPIKQRHSGN